MLEECRARPMEEMMMAKDDGGMKSKAYRGKDDGKGRRRNKKKCLGWKG